MSQDKQLQTIFVEALELSTAEERGRFLDEVCGNDPGLRARAEKLLAAHEQAEGFLETRAPGTERAESVRVTHNPPLTEGPGSLVRGYKLLQEIGEGGFGVVYMAEQKEPIRRKVAFKVIKPGMDTRQVVARFEAERQALALMDHPNIARVLDAGTTDGGRPFFVMELVKGIPIIEFCDKNKLGMEERLEIFLKVCSAVQHAHQKGIIHRDLKPSNVLITLHDGVPVPKVIDFGIAKALNQELTEKSLFTAYGQMIGTPQYMSPEQAEMSGLDVDTRSDIYSLGVLLYELLTGRTPIELARLRNAGFEEMKRMIQEDEAAKPSLIISTMGETATTVADHRRVDPRRLTEHLKGDLDWIVMKALEKDRSRRYDSAAAFAHDIQRHMRHEPVEAAAPGLVYLLTKFSRRHRRMFTVAAAIFASLLLGVIGMSFLYLHAETQREAAERARELAHQQSERAGREKDLAERAEANALAASRRAAVAKEQAERAAFNESAARSLAEQVAEKNRQALYSADMQLAAQFWDDESGSTEAIDRILTSHIPGEGQADLRDFAWRHQWRRMHRGVSFERQFDGLAAAGFLPSGRLITGDRSGRIQEWDFGATNAVRELVLPGTNEIRKIVLSPDGGKVGVVRRFSAAVYDTRTGEAIREQSERYPAWDLRFSPDSSTLTILSSTPRQQRVRVWNLADGTARWVQSERGGRRPARFAEPSPDGGRILFGSGSGNGPIEILSPDAPGIELSRQHRSTVFSAAWSPSGKRAATGDANGKIVFWDTKSWETNLVVSGHASGVHGIAFSRDSRLVATGGEDGTVKIWEMPAGKLRRQHRGHTTRITQVSFSHDDALVCSVDEGGTVHCWPVSDAGEIPFWSEPEERLYRVAHSPDGIWLAAGGEVPILWNLNEPGPPRRFDTRADAVAFSPDSLLLGFGSRDGTARVWDLDKQEIVREFKHRNPIGSVAFSPDGKTLACAVGIPFFRSNYRQCPILLHDLTTDEPRRPLLHHNRFVSALRFSPDGRHLASASHEGEVALWDTKTRKLVKSFKQPDSAFYSVAFSPDGSLLAAGADRAIRVWKVESGEPVATLEGHGNWVADVAFAPDGKSLASASWDHTVKLWNLASWLETRTLKGHTGWVNGLAFSPDGNTLTTADIDGTVRRWRATPLAEADADSATLKSVVDLAEAQRQRKNLLGAEKFFRKAVELGSAQSGANHPEVLDWRLRVVEALHGQERFLDAAAESERTLASAVGAREPDQSRIDALAGAILTAYKKESERLVEAANREDAAALMTGAAGKVRELLREHQVLATFLHESGRHQARLNQFKKAEASFREALRIRRQLLADTDPAVIDTLHHLGGAIWRGGEHDAAEPLLREVLAARRERSRQEPMPLAETLGELAEALAESMSPAKQEESETLLGEALRLKLPASNRIAIVTRLVELNEDRELSQRAERWRARLVAEQGDTEMAADLLEKLRLRLEAELGSDHAETVATRDALLELNGALGERLVSERKFDEARQVLTEYFQHKPDDWERAILLGSLHAMKQDAEAHARFCRRLLPRMESSENPDALFAFARTALLLDHYEDDRELLETTVDLARRALELEPDHELAALTIGIAECRARRLKQCSAWLAKVFRDDSSPDTAAVRYYAAIRSFHAGEKTRMDVAIRMALQPAIENTPKQACSYLWLAVALREAMRKQREFDESAEPQPPITKRFPVTTDPLPERSRETGPAQLDLSSHYNAALTQTWLTRDPDYPVHGLRSLGPGLHTLDGVAFDARGVIQLGGRVVFDRLLDYPTEAAPIPVARKVRRLHFLHGLSWANSTRNGTEVGRLRMGYADGSEETLSIKFGEQALDWWKRGDSGTLKDPNSSIAWEGKAANGQELHLFRTAWQNPHPYREIQHIVFSTDDSEPAPFLLAVTVE